MTDWAPWFRYQLQASADGLIWAFAQIDRSRYEHLPPAPGFLGTWPPARHVWHITEYERCLAIPSMRQWLGGAPPSEDDWPDDDATWAAVQCREFDALADAFRAIRQEQIRLLDQLEAVDWTAPRETLWGWKPLAMVVTKTFQHTYEHGDTLLRMGLWWEEGLRRQAEEMNTGE